MIRQATVSSKYVNFSTLIRMKDFNQQLTVRRSYKIGQVDEPYPPSISLPLLSLLNYYSKHNIRTSKNNKDTLK